MFPGCYGDLAENYIHAAHAAWLLLIYLMVEHRNHQRMRASLSVTT
jgi:hypothetical protein